MDYSSFVNTIPSRLKESNCLRNAIDSILTQTLPPQKVYVCIPQYYKRFDIVMDESLFPEWMKENPRIEIISGYDYGPATMYVYSLAIGGITCFGNDDVVYDSAAFENLARFKMESGLDAVGGWSFLWWKKNRGFMAEVPDTDIDEDIVYLQSVDMVLTDSSFYEGFDSFLRTCHSECPESFLYDDLTNSYYLQYNKKKIDSLHHGEDDGGIYKQQETAEIDSISLRKNQEGKFKDHFIVVDYLKERFPIA